MNPTSSEPDLRTDTANGVLLLVAAAAALLWANSPWAASYVALWHTPIGPGFASFTFERSLAWVVNDGLMVLFFFGVGLEIRREIHHGELSEARKAALPVVAALGGMLVPAALYLSLAGDPETRAGWGVPMATDIAFAMGILSLLGKRVPSALRVLLLAVAVIDDLGAIVIIALFYSSGVALSGLLVAALGLIAILVLQRLGVQRRVAYVAPALTVWAGIASAGIHPTIAGVIIGLVTPPHSASSLLERLQPWVAFGIMPLFALANAGVALSGAVLTDTSLSVVSAVVVGLVFGKPLGVLFATWLILRLRLGALPTGITARHLLVLGSVAGVGFTMALFIAQLAFVDERLLAAAKLGILIASGVAAVLGLAFGSWLLAPLRVASAPAVADEVERATEK